MTLQTEFPFTLPQGYVDADGNMHKQGIMRLATAFDEIAPMKDPRVQGNPAYVVIIILSRVIFKLGDVDNVNPKTIEGLYAGDLDYLQQMYSRINLSGRNTVTTVCPHCEHEFDVEVEMQGES